MTRGTITNKQTGLEITGDSSEEGNLNWFSFRIEGTAHYKAFNQGEWDFTPEPEPIKPGVYIYKGSKPEMALICKYRDGEWRDADGYPFMNQNMNISKLVRLVPEA